MHYTEKLYYSEPFLKECSAKVIHKRNGNEICLDRTVAYPEGGGQISDIGILSFGDIIVPFTDVQKGNGRIFYAPDFPAIHVDTPVYHIVSSADYDRINIGQELHVRIDVNRRIWTTVHHSAIHLAFMFAMQLRSDLESMIKGANISESSGRLDFAIADRFTEQEIAYINENLGKIIADAVPLTVFAHEDEDEAWYWKCNDFVNSCGGTHVTNSKYIGSVLAKRKGLGKGSERLIVTVSNPILSEHDYY